MQSSLTRAKLKPSLCLHSHSHSHHTANLSIAHAQQGDGLPTDSCVPSDDLAVPALPFRRPCGIKQVPAWSLRLRIPYYHPQPPHLTLPCNLTTPPVSWPRAFYCALEQERLPFILLPPSCNLPQWLRKLLCAALRNRACFDLSRVTGASETD